MAVVYVDTSALGRVLLGEPDAPAILRDLGGFDQRVASRLLRVEFRRLALREHRLHDADQLLAGLALIGVDEAILAAAEAVAPSTVATLDAIHLVTALALASAGLLDAIMTYDSRLADGARQHGLTVLAPQLTWPRLVAVLVRSGRTSSVCRSDHTITTFGGRGCGPSTIPRRAALPRGDLESRACPSCPSTRSSPSPSWNSGSCSGGASATSFASRCAAARAPRSSSSGRGRRPPTACPACITS